MSETAESPCTPYRIAVVIGTVRPGNFTSKAARLVADEIARSKHASVDLIDTAELDLALPGRAPTEDAAALQARVKEAAGVVLATPEYHGSFSCTLKLVIENLQFPSLLAGKPIALLGVAAGAIGAIKSLEHLRSVCSHVGGLVLPGPVSIAGVQKVFDADGACLDPAVETRVRALASGLMTYVEERVCARHALERMAREGAD